MISWLRRHLEENWDECPPARNKDWRKNGVQGKRGWKEKRTHAPLLKKGNEIKPRGNGEFKQFEGGKKTGKHRSKRLGKKKVRPWIGQGRIGTKHPKKHNEARTSNKREYQTKMFGGEGWWVTNR